MDENNGSKLTGIRQIVKLKEFLQKWQSVTIGSRANATAPQRIRANGGISPDISANNPGGISPDISNRLKGKVYCESDEESCHSPGPPPDVPKGYLAVYVGPELRRFIIPTSYLSHSLFKVLLEKVEEEFGFDHSGGLTIPCEIETFKFLLNYMEHHPTGHHDASAEEFLNH